MDVMIKPRQWLEMELRSTEELLRIWETRNLDIWPEESLQSVEQVLVARNMIEISEDATSFAWLPSKEDPLIDEFTVRQIKNKKISYIWIVKLKEKQATLYCPVTGDEFTLERRKSPKEFRFQKAGFLMLGESNTALVQGRIFDFGEHKRNLLSWMPDLAKMDMREMQQRWGIVMLMGGSVSLFLSTLVNPLWGSLLAVLGLVNLILPGKSLFVLNGLSLFFIGALNVYASFDSFCASKTYPLFISAFWTLFGLWLIFWGINEINKLWRFVKINQ